MRSKQPTPHAIQLIDVIIKRLPPNLKNSVIFLAISLNISLMLALASLLSGISTSVQAKYKYRCPTTGVIFETSEFFIIVSESGSGKTRASKRAYKVLLCVIENHQLEVKGIVEISKQKLAEWEKSRATLVRARAKLANLLGTPEFEVQDALLREKEELLEKLKPQVPIMVTMIYDRVDSSGLIYLFSDGVKVATLKLDEASKLLDSKNSQFINDVCTLSEQSKITYKTRHNKQLTIEGTLSLLLSTQPEIFWRLLEKQPDLYNSGFLNRAKVVGMGHPPYVSFDQTPLLDQEMPLDKRLSENMEESIKRITEGNNEPVILEPEQSAIDFANNVMAPKVQQLTQKYPNMDGYLKRFTTSAARHATLIHLSEKSDGKISAYDLETGCLIEELFADEFYRTCVPIPVEIEQVANFFSWLPSNWPRLIPQNSSDGLYMYFDRSQIQKIVDGSLRKPDVLNSMLEHAEKMGWLTREIYGRKTLIKIPKSRFLIQPIGLTPPQPPNPFAFGSW